MVLIDTGGDMYGYQSDISRTFTYPIGSYTQDQLAWWTTVYNAQQAALQVRELTCLAKPPRARVG